MTYQIDKEEVWVGAVEDRPGGLAERLEVLSRAGVNLEFMIAMRTLDTPGAGGFFMTPLSAEDAILAAEKSGLSRWTTAHGLRIEGPDRRELGADIARAVALAGVSMRGASAAKIGEQVVFHLAFDSTSDTNKAANALIRALNG
ncbi:MAG: hypothetical protein JSU68_00965 [Phycisphaerales bacterium]|nr:MAG: hypothetical protein JSU68_00965 [Phycisphaerales bacterium]